MLENVFTKYFGEYDGKELYLWLQVTHPGFAYMARQQCFTTRDWRK